MNRNKIKILGALWLLCAVSACVQPAGPFDATCKLQPAETFGPAGSVAVKAETVVSGLEVPWGVAFLPGGDILITERSGALRISQQGQLVETSVLNVDRPSTSEGGLLGLALHPQFGQGNRDFYLYYTTQKAAGAVNRVERYTLAEDGLSATSQGVIIDDIPASRFHNGGRLRFGPDGMLYVGTGDASSPGLSQDLTSLAGKILRAMPDGSVPQDNPFADSLVYLIGLRNTQGFAWRAPGELWVTDHGPSGDLGRRDHDEVSFAKAGENLGWPTVFACEERDGLVAPSLTWGKAVPPGGAAIYTGDAIAAWKGSLMVGALGAKHLHRVVFDAQQPGQVTLHETYFLGDAPEGLGRIREVLMGPDNHLYLTTSNCDGRGSCPSEKDRLVRIVPAP